MILFWICALVLIVLALALVLPPLLRKGRASDQVGDTSRSLELYRSRIAALEEQHRIGALTESDLAQARDELARELLADTQAGAPARPSRAPRSGVWLAVAVGVGLPVASVLLYQHLGQPAAVNPPPARAGTGEADIERMVAGLAERLQAEPDNSEGWLLLARSYMVLERYAEAATAYAAAHRLLGDSATLLADRAEAEALRDGQDFLGAPSERLERALQLEPEHPKALWLGAFAAMQRGDSALAVERWRMLLAAQPPDSDAAEVLRGLIANAGGDHAPAAGDASALTVHVIVADRLVAELDGSETLFVFARAADGPPMPLAVVRKRVSDLPLTVILDDSMSMAGRKLSDVERVVVGARIAMSGTPTASRGDLQGFSPPVIPGDDAPVSVTITERVP
jgi:cytochrome c-type biogenesis protein CcmH